MLWIRLLEYLNDRLFCCAINLRHIIVLRFVFDRQFVEIERSAVDHGTGAARGFDRDIEYWMHGKLSVPAVFACTKELEEPIFYYDRNIYCLRYRRTHSYSGGIS